jgi:hypothetical protein
MAGGVMMNMQLETVGAGKLVVDVQYLMYQF